MPKQPVALMATLGFLCLFSYQNCSNVNFGATADLQSQEAYQLLCPNGCVEGKLNSRENTEKPEVKVVLVTDNSFSMSQSQEKLALGVRSLIDRLKGFTTSYHLFTTTQEGSKAVAVKQRVCERRRGSLTDILPDPNCPGKSAGVFGEIYSQIDIWNLAPSLTNGDEFRITEQAGDFEFSALKQRLGDAISSPNGGVGTDGSDREQGICTLARTVYEQGPNQIFNRGDVAVFTVISDEDDFTDLNSCLSEIRTQTDCTTEDTTPVEMPDEQLCMRPECASISVDYEVDLGARTANLETIHYQRVRKPYFSRKIKYDTRAVYEEKLTFEIEIPNPPRDGVPQPDTVSPGSLERGSLPSCNMVADSPCESPEQLKAVQKRASELGGSYKENSCRVVSCTQTQPASTTPLTKNVTSVPSCNELTLKQCEAALGSVTNYKAESCSAPVNDENDCKKIEPAPEPKTLAAKEVDTPRANSACTPSEIDLVKSKIGGIYSYVDGSCNVNSSTKVYEASSETYTIKHESTDNEADVTANSYCGERLYINSETLQKYASRTLNNRPVTACRIKKIGNVQRKMETVTKMVPPPPGTPRCVAQSPISQSFPKKGEGADVSTAFREGAQLLFGSNYFVSAIVHASANDENCPIQPGQSLGTKYMDLAHNSPGGRGVIASICSPDYGVAFDDVSKWVVKSLENTYVIPNLSVHDEVLSVWIRRNGQDVLIMPGEIEINGSTVKFIHPEILKPGDEIHYRVRLGQSPG